MLTDVKIMNEDPNAIWKEFDAFARSQMGIYYPEGFCFPDLAKWEEERRRDVVMEVMGLFARQLSIKLFRDWEEKWKIAKHS